MCLNTLAPFSKGIWDNDILIDYSNYYDELQEEEDDDE